MVQPHVERQKTAGPRCVQIREHVEYDYVWPAFVSVWKMLGPELQSSHTETHSHVSRAINDKEHTACERVHPMVLCMTEFVLVENAIRS